MNTIPYEFYTGVYLGDRLGADAWPAAEARARAEYARLNRIYTLIAPTDPGLDASPEEQAHYAVGLAICAIADELAAWADADRDGIAESVTVGSVRTTRAAATLPDCSPAARGAALLRCCRRYLNLYRGCPC